MIKGHTKIELTNVKTGEKRVVEDDNMVTNAINKYFEFSLLKRNYFKKISNPMIDNYFGGLLLFQNQIEENVDNYLLPDDNLMVGNACVNYSTGNSIPELGSYNAEESSYTVEKGVATRKYVYDFGTSKGNGTISSVCLTNFAMGYLGAGNKSVKRESLTVNNVNFTNNYCLTDADMFLNKENSFNMEYFTNGVTAPTDYGGWNCLGIDPKNNCAYMITEYSFKNSNISSSLHFKNGYLDVYKVNIPFNKLSPAINSINYYTVYDKVRLQTPEILKTLSYVRAFIIMATDAMYLLVSNEEVSPSSKFYLWKISADLKTSEVITLTNTTSDTFKFGAYYYNSQPFQIHKNFFFYSDGVKIYKIDLTNPTNVTEIGFNKSEDTNGFYYLFSQNPENIYAVFRGNSEYTAVVYKIDTVNNTAYPMNGSPTLGTSSKVSESRASCMLDSKDYAIVIGQYGRLSSLSIVRNPFTLSTINNLSEPVMKTSDMTMKITYTITSKIEPDEEE